MSKFKKNKDGVELHGLGKLTLNDVFNDPNGLGYAVADSDYYYVFPKYQPGMCGDAFWMINKKNINEVSTTSTTFLFDTPHVLDRLDKLKPMTIETLRRALK